MSRSESGVYEDSTMSYAKPLSVQLDGNNYVLTNSNCYIPYNPVKYSNSEFSQNGNKSQIDQSAAISNYPNVVGNTVKYMSYIDEKGNDIYDRKADGFNPYNYPLIVLNNNYPDSYPATDFLNDPKAPLNDRNGSQYFDYIYNPFIYGNGRPCLDIDHDFCNNEDEINGISSHNGKDIDLWGFPRYWLTENFERVDEECTIARSTMYNFYIYACHERNETPMNSAGLGKIIRLVFGNIKNRRLGARGDSRYHYLGLRVKLNSYVSKISASSLQAVCMLYSKPVKKVSNSISQSSIENGVDMNGYDDNLRSIEVKTEQTNGLSNSSENLYNSIDRERISKLIDMSISFEFMCCRIGLSADWQPIMETIHTLCLDSYNHIIFSIIKSDEDELVNKVNSFWKSNSCLSVKVSSGRGYQTRTDRALPYIMLESPNLRSRPKRQSVTFLELSSVVKIQRYIYELDCIAFGNIVDGIFPDLHTFTNRKVIKRFSYLLQTWLRVMTENLSIYPDNFKNLKVTTLRCLVNWVKEFERLYEVGSRTGVRVKVENGHSKLTDESTVCQSAFSIDWKGLYNNYSQLFRTFTSPIELLHECFLDSLDILKGQDIEKNLTDGEHIYKKIKKHCIEKSQSDDSPEKIGSSISSFLQNWVVYYNLAIQYLFGNKAFESPKFQNCCFFIVRLILMMTRMECAKSRNMTIIAMLCEDSYRLSSKSES